MLTEFSFSCSPSPLGRDDLRFEFLFGVDVTAPAFFFTVNTSQLAWSSLCVLFPALMTLKEKPEKADQGVVSGKLSAQPLSQGSAKGTPQLASNDLMPRAHGLSILCPE